ncbi:MAG TPA: TonB C-terminal domain-containing protein [Candidatus Acidoferrum sp.]|nr:TonB C-terminal domain-containing protein [Candidatus Acidoferrum sp.]
MLPQSQARKKRNSSKVNLLISFVFHALIVLTMFYFAARQGLLGKQLKKIAVEMVKEKPPEKPKEPEKPQEEPPKVEAPKVVERPKVVEEAKAAPPPPVSLAPPAVAPPAAELPAFEFEGGKAVETSSDPAQLYKGYVEYALRSKWQRPDNMADDNYVAEVEVSVDRKGRISDPVWEKSSGDSRWDDSVRQVLAAVKSLDRPPPTNFPPRVVVRFDVQAETEPISQ